MNQNSTQHDYPRDRFDDVERYTTQQGAHRKEFPVPKGAGQLNAIILAGGAALAIGIGSYLWLYPSNPLNQAGADPEETVSTTVEDEPQDADEDIEPEEVEEPEPVETPEPVELEEPEESPEPEESEEPEETEEPTPEETEEPEDEVDFGLPVSVYNASTIQGYAASVAQDLGAAGFNVPVADNWSGQVPAQNTVYFSHSEATALAVAEEVGAVAIYEPSVDGVLVVLTAD